MILDQDKQKIKGLILAAGKGTRLRPFTHTLVKPLMPVANKPVVQYIIENLKECGILDIGVVIGPDHLDMWKNHIGDGSKFGVKLTYIYQHYPKGLAHAVSRAKNFIGNDDFVLYLGDILRGKSIVEFVRAFEHDRKTRVVIKKSPVPFKFGVVELNSKMEVIGLEEKPEKPKTDTVQIGIWALTGKIFEAIENIKPSKRGELEITDALRWLIENGEVIKTELVTDWWHDAGRLDSFLEANYFVLKEMKGNHSGSNITGEVEIGKNSTIDPSAKIVGPVKIGNNCTIGANSYIGPFTSIGNGVKIENSSIENSIILRESEINGVKNIKDSMIGHKCKIHGKGKDSSLYIGDHSLVYI